MSVQHVDPDGTVRALWDDEARTFYAYDEAGVEVEARPYTADEHADADERAAQAVAAAEQAAAAAVEAALTADETADHPRLETAIADLATLLGDNTVEGSIRAWRATLTRTYDVADLRALASILITTAQTQRRVARSLYRLSKLTTRDLDSADVGPE